MYFFFNAVERAKKAARSAELPRRNKMEKPGLMKRHGGAVIAIIMGGLLLLMMLLNAN